MMQRLTRAERVAAGLWLILAIVVWNGLYDLLLARSTQDYLFRWALHEAGRGPAVDVSLSMHHAVRDAMWMATLWAGIILLAGVVTVRLLRHKTR
jgi:hypothetical protein